MLSRVMKLPKLFGALFLFVSLSTLHADSVRLENFEYPFPVKTYRFTNQHQELEMVYMDVQSKKPAKGTIVLLHGKNFSGAYWKQTAQSLTEAGYRVVMPDQIGFGKSSKPQHYQFSFHQLAANTHALLRSLDIEKSHILGHSMGGMVATRYALLFPNEVESLTLMNPIGLEDWLGKGVPYVGIDAGYQQELKQTPEKIRSYQLENYYDGRWRPEYEPWVKMLTQFIESSDYKLMAWDQALTTDMVLTQPVVHEFPQIKAPTLLIIGQRDRTALGKNLVPEEKRKALGNYPELGRKAAAAIPNSKLVELEGIGHMPHIEAFEKFITPLQTFLKAHTK